eukprot:952641-Pelagomonas_calceolata.AAC.1
MASTYGLVPGEVLSAGSGPHARVCGEAGLTSQPLGEHGQQAGGTTIESFSHGVAVTLSLAL